MDRPDSLIPLLKEMNGLARQQQGYISTHTLQSKENPDDFLVISSWENEDDWKTWFLNPKRKDIQDKVDSLIGERTFYELFNPVF